MRALGPTPSRRISFGRLWRHELRWRHDNDRTGSDPRNMQSSDGRQLYYRRRPKLDNTPPPPLPSPPQLGTGEWRGWGHSRYIESRLPRVPATTYRPILSAFPGVGRERLPVPPRTHRLKGKRLAGGSSVGRSRTRRGSFPAGSGYKGAERRRHRCDFRQPKRSRPLTGKIVENCNETETRITTTEIGARPLQIQLVPHHIWTKLFVFPSKKLITRVILADEWRTQLR